MSELKTVAKRLLLLALVVGIVGCDRVSKHVAAQTLAGEPAQSYLLDTVQLSYAENPGSFLSLGAELPELVRFAIFTLGVGIVLVWLTAHAILARWSGASLVGVTMFVAGGASNWVDRLSDGIVVDFLKVGVGPIRTGIFNVADMALMAGLVILCLSEIFRGRKQRHGHRRSG